MRNRYVLILIIFSCITFLGNIYKVEAKDLKIFNYKTQGNLAVTNKLTCISIKEMKNDYTPADLYPAVRDCVDKGKLKNASEIYYIAGAYSFFDILRVSDRTAHQAKKVLMINNFSTLSGHQRESWVAELNKIIADNTDFCKAVKNIGKPNYQPVYMAAHGIRAFSINPNELIKTDFDSKKAWTRTLTQYLRCKL